MAWLQKLFIPSSVVGGLVGLAIFTIFSDRIPAELFSGIKVLPGFLINVVFATLFLGIAPPKFKDVYKIVMPQFCFGQLLAWGQYVIGLGLVALVLLPVFGVNVGFGNLLEIGFEGGHGTVGGMNELFVGQNWQEGIALGMTVATFGMIFGVVAGMYLINWAIRKKHINSVEMGNEDNLGASFSGFLHPEKQPEAGRQTVASFSVDSLAWHVALVGVAIALGYWGLWGMKQACAAWLPNSGIDRVLAGFPLFPLCMIGGLLLQKFMTMLGKDYLIDRGQMQRISGSALDFLVLSALVAVQLKVVMDNFLPLLILIIAGCAWSFIAVRMLGPRIFSEAWFERSIAEFGQSSGVTATGLLLLRTVDPENRTCASRAFGYKQLLHEPIMGGGLWTVMAFILVYKFGVLAIWGISVGMFGLWLVIFFCFRKYWR